MAAANALAEEGIMAGRGKSWTHLGIAMCTQQPGAMGKPSAWCLSTSQASSTSLCHWPWALPWMHSGG
eukprot:114245-Prorocentrum_lima.AAC.1